MNEDIATTHKLLEPLTKVPKHGTIVYCADPTNVTMVQFIQVKDTVDVTHLLKRRLMYACEVGARLKAMSMIYASTHSDEAITA